jgi:hypothetical protein
MEFTSTKARWAAVTAGLVAFGGSLQTALVDNAVTASEWVTIGLATVVAVGGVFGFTYAAPANRPKNPEV